MSAEFSAKLSALRKDRDISQKQAAIDLDVSQALLSHYEKGIRECSLDFVKKCAHYYGVSADFLLGLTDHPHGGGELAFFDELETDKAYGAKTVLRALVALGQNAQAKGEENGAFFADYFALCVARYAAVLAGDRDNRLPGLETAVRFTEQIGTKDRRDPTGPGEDTSIRTVLKEADRLETAAITRLLRE